MMADFTDDSRHANRVFLTVAAQVFLVCAAILLFFVQLSLSFSVATALTLAAIFLGSLACWRDFGSAQIVFLLSLIVVQFVILSYVIWLLVPFLAFDIGLVYLFSKNWTEKED